MFKMDSNLKKLLSLAPLVSLSFTAGAAEIATDFGDYQPAPAGVDLFLLYAQATQFDSYYVDGEKVDGDFDMETNIGLLRWVHFIELGGYIIDPQIVVPFGEVSLNKDFGALEKSSSSGIGDPLIGGTIWLYNDTTTKRSFGLTAFMSLPMGEYDGDQGAINIGYNRWKTIFQAAYETPITDNISLSLLGEYNIYGRNDDFYGEEQTKDDSYGLQTHLAYLFSSTTNVSVSYYHDFGGETSVNGVDQRDEMDNSRWLLSGSTFITPSIQLKLQYGKALDVENGAYEDTRFQFRVTKVF